jgi:hypothetical protein
LVGDVVRRVWRGRDVYLHWREAHPNEPLQEEDDADVDAATSSSNRERPHTFETTEELVAQCSQNRADMKRNKV